MQIYADNFLIRNRTGLIDPYGFQRLVVQISKRSDVVFLGTNNTISANYLILASRTVSTYITRIRPWSSGRNKRCSIGTE